MKRAYYCIQCTDRISGEVGSFAYFENFRALSPVFTSLVILFAWADAEGYELQMEVLA